MGNFYVSLSKFLSYILRHHPEKFDICLDDKGFADLEKILRILKNRYPKKKITKKTLQEMIKRSNKKRFELREKKIRAYYGHSIDRKIKMEKAEMIPSFLFHGTTAKAYKKIQKLGLKKRNRQYVHLSKTIETAIDVGSRKTNRPILLRIDVLRAKKSGINFYKSGDMYLAERIPPRFLEKQDLN